MKIVSPALFFRTLFYIALTAITILAFLPNYEALPPLLSFSDLLNHSVAFTVLFILFRLSNPMLLTRDIAVILLAYAILIEIVQYFLPTRYASWSDIAADVTGLLLGCVIFFLLRQFLYIKNLFFQ